MDSFSHKYGESTFYFVLVTKCRYKMFGKREHKYLFRDILLQIAERHRIAIRSLAIGDDHTHIIATIHPTMSPSKAFQLLKGASSWALFRAIPNFRRRYPRGHLWGKNGTFRSIGEVDYYTVADYVERQNQMNLTEFIAQEFPTF
jgi:putative transposase